MCLHNSRPLVLGAGLIGRSKNLWGQAKKFKKLVAKHQKMRRMRASLMQQSCRANKIDFKQKIVCKSVSKAYNSRPTTEVVIQVPGGLELI